MNKSKRWNDFFEKNKNIGPRSYLVDALQYVKNKEKALDLGAGTLRDSKYLLEQGFKEVTAVDSEEQIQSFAQNINNLEIIVSRFEDLELTENTYDLINAQYSLPFMKKEYFIDFITKVKKALKKDGIFVGTFFGINDSWNTDEYKTEIFHTREELLKLFDGYELIELLEKEENKPAVNQEMKHWHSFHVTAQKK